MKLKAAMLIVCVWAAALAAAAEWTLIGSWPTPGPEPRGMDYGWLASDGSPALIYRIVTGTGSISASFAAPGGAGVWGVCRGTNYQNLFVSNYTSSYIYNVTTAGSILSSFMCALPGPAGMEFSSGLYVSFPNQNLIASVNMTTGSIISSFSGPGSRVTACWWSGAFAADSETHAIYGNQQVIIAGIETPCGLCGIGTTREPATLIYVADAATDYVYTYYNGAAVEPASLGRVKAVYR